MKRTHRQHSTEAVWAILCPKGCRDCQCVPGVSGMYGHSTQTAHRQLQTEILCIGAAAYAYLGYLVGTDTCVAVCGRHLCQ